MTESITFSTLDIHFADFIVRIDRNPVNELWWGAALASYSARFGNTCFDLFDGWDVSTLPAGPFSRQLPLPDIRQWPEALKQCDTVGTPGTYAPLLLDPAGRLYLYRCWSYEQHVADGILSRIRPLVTNEIRLEAALDRYFPVQGTAADLQRSAARMALTHRFSVVSGGPGTGKTATVAGILALLLDLAGDSHLEIELAAPTGKAAIRLQKSVLQAADRLALPDEIRSHLPAEVRTIHRLLGVRTRTGGFRHNRQNRLSCDILVIDEASMVDLQLMASLMDALRDNARLILLGDRNQLASVEAGAVLADICNSANREAVPVTQLTRSYRFNDDSGIAALSSLINNGQSAAAVEFLKSGQHPDIIWRQFPTGQAFDDAFDGAVRNGFAGYIRAESPADALDALNSFRILSPLRAGALGVDNLNKLCERSLATIRISGPRRLHLTPVMITGNNYELELYNGDTGVVEDVAGSPTVWFENARGELRHISELRLPPREAAFALTVHKSQGSEFDRILLILPDRETTILSRELLYTAVTRARCQIEIWGSEEIICQAIDRRILRKSGLGERLASGAHIG
jgi:exodeoxyribonuclease V alpha subunit